MFSNVLDMSFVDDWLTFQWNFYFIEKAKVKLGVEADNKHWWWKGSVNYQFGIGLSVGLTVGAVKIYDDNKVIGTKYYMMGYILGKYIIIIYVNFFAQM